MGTPGCTQVGTRNYLSIYLNFFCLWKCSRLKPYFNSCSILIWSVSAVIINTWLSSNSTQRPALGSAPVVVIFDSTVYFQT